MHPDSPEIFATLSRMGYKVRVVGGPEQQQLLEQVTALGGNIEVFGRVDNVLPFFSESDVFVYPLRSDHYGTGEQVILEAMASGLPVVAFANAAERSILRDSISGVLVSSTEEFVNAVDNLCSNPDQAVEISQGAIFSVQNQFSPQIMTERFIEILNQQITLRKSPVFQKILDSHDFESLKGTEVSKLGIYALHSFFDQSIFHALIKQPKDSVRIVYSKIEPELTHRNTALKWLANSKSTPFHYLNYFPNDAELQCLTNLVQSKVSSLGLS